jgi:excisionase family DNA binding protein
MKALDVNLMTATEVGTLLNVSPKAVYLWALTGQLPSVRLGKRCVRFRRDDVQILVEARWTGGCDGKQSAARRRSQGF